MTTFDFNIKIDVNALFVCTGESTVASSVSDISSNKKHRGAYPQVSTIHRTTLQLAA